MTEPVTPLKRPITGPGLLALVGVMAAAEGFARHSYGLVGFGALLAVAGVALGYQAWRAGKTPPGES